MASALASLAFGSDEQLKALGRMTILFASLDQAIAELADAFLKDHPGFSNLHDGRPIPELRFEDKQELLKKLVRAVANNLSYDVSGVIDALGKAKDASKQRNRVIHGKSTKSLKRDQSV